MDAPALSPPDQHTRLIRSYALREDADRARDVLADSGIGATVRDMMSFAVRGAKPEFRGCTLSVAPSDASAATRLLLKMPPSEAPSTGRKPTGRDGDTSRRSEAPSRLVRRSSPPIKQRGSIFMIGIALACAATVVIFSILHFMSPKKKGPPQRTANYRIEEDLNGDTLPDVIREFTPRWEPLYHAEDRNFDDELDLQWSYQRGKPAYREVDINYDGKFDERTTFDPEGQPFISDFRPGGKGPVLRRLIYRHGLLWKLLEDRDADSNFDHLREFDRFAAVMREEENLPPGSDENAQPKWPLPEWPDEEEQEPKLLLTPPPPRSP